MNYLFTYGTLQDPKIQKKLFNKTLKGTNDSLSGYEERSISLSGNTYPILIKSNKTNATIKGTCYKLTNDEIAICDDYEGSSYKRILVQLTSNQNAWVYIAAS